MPIFLDPISGRENKEQFGQEDYINEETHATFVSEMQFLLEMNGGEAMRWWKKIGGKWFTVGESSYLKIMESRVNNISSAHEKDSIVLEISKDIAESKQAIEDINTSKVTQMAKSAGLAALLSPLAGIAGGGVPAFLAAFTGGVIGGIAAPFAGSLAGLAGGAAAATHYRFKTLSEGLHKFVEKLEELKKKASAFKDK